MKWSGITHTTYVNKTKTKNEKLQITKKNFQATTNQRKNKKKKQMLCVVYGMQTYWNELPFRISLLKEFFNIRSHSSIELIFLNTIFLPLCDILLLLFPIYFFRFNFISIFINLQYLNWNYLHLIMKIADLFIRRFSSLFFSAFVSGGWKWFQLQIANWRFVICDFSTHAHT